MVISRLLTHYFVRNVSNRIASTSILVLIKSSIISTQRSFPREYLNHLFIVILIIASIYLETFVFFLQDHRQSNSVAKGSVPNVNVDSWRSFLFIVFILGLLRETVDEIVSIGKVIGPIVIIE